MKTERLFDSQTDRYAFDFDQCSYGNGFAQIDTGQDASYFGTWANPETLQIVCFCEGDVTIKTANDNVEFSNELKDIKHWNDKNGHRFYGIDPGFSGDMKQAFINVGCEELLH